MQNVSRLIGGEEVTPEVQTNNEASAVFVNSEARKSRRFLIVIASVSLLSGVGLFTANFAGLTHPVTVSILAAALMCILAVVHLSLMFSGRIAVDYPEIVVDRDGIHLCGKPETVTESIGWDRFRAAETDESALILSFEAKDLSSDDPRDRISRIRIPIGGPDFAGLLGAIDRYRADAKT